MNISGLYGMEIVVVPDTVFPQEIWAQEVHIYPWHRFWFWLYRAIGWSTGRCFDVLPGRILKRPTTECYRLGNRLYCTARFKRQMEQAIS